MGTPIGTFAANGGATVGGGVAGLGNDSSNGGFLSSLLGSALGGAIGNAGNQILQANLPLSQAQQAQLSLQYAQQQNNATTIRYVLIAVVAFVAAKMFKLF